MLTHDMKEPKFPKTDEWIKRSWSIYTMKYYIAAVVLLSLLLAFHCNLDGNGGLSCIGK